MDLFSYEKMNFYLPKHVRLFEAFSGIGTQAMALKRIGFKVEHVGFSEVDIHAIKSYKAIHGDVKNFGDIRDIDNIPLCDVFTWSFPCTDLSKAGKQKGLFGTRSGLAFEVIRILKSTNEKPRILLMENVPDLLSSKFRSGWHEIYNEIELLGYKNYVEVLNAKHYGIPQNRVRVFMISILGDYNYDFPKPFLLKNKLNSFLETNVDERFYLTEEHLKKISLWKSNQNPLNNMLDIDSDVTPTLTARGAGENHSGMILIRELSKRGYSVGNNGDGVCLDRAFQKRGVVQKSMIQTIKTSGSDVGVIQNNRVRRITPLESWRLMGISDDDFQKAQSICSNTQLYKQAGNAIVVNVLSEIFRGFVRDDRLRIKVRK
ncbi:MAG: DNA (cytosine-5-)-methyltransferase [Acholeplasma sp.]|nr:DNA (cytosine-5-)-methyltransferase [Acholeplasma sp.]